jgi:hypothetical protein
VTTNSFLKQAKKKEEKRKSKYPFFPLFQVLDQSGCRVERIFVSTNSLPTQAEKKKKQKQTNPFFPYFKSWTNPVAGWNNFVDQSQPPLKKLNFHVAISSRPGDFKRRVTSILGG